MKNGRSDKKSLFNFGIRVSFLSLLTEIERHMYRQFYKYGGSYPVRSTLRVVFHVVTILEGPYSLNQNVERASSSLAKKNAIISSVEPQKAIKSP